MENIELYIAIASGVLLIGSEVIAQLPVKENSWLQLLGKLMRVVANGNDKPSVKR
jgi:hypothetical protein